jgi:hypothetical protein
MPNDCRSDDDNEPTFDSIDAEALVFGSNSQEVSPVEDHEVHEANLYLSLHQNEHVTFGTGVQKTTAQHLYDSHQLSGRALGPQNDSLYHIELSLKQKRDELATAENTVSRILAEIKILEKARLRRRDQHFEATPKPNKHHKRGNDESLHNAKRLRERATSLDFNSRISRHSSNNREETACLYRVSLPSTKGPSPLRKFGYSWGQNNQTVSKYTATHAITASEAPALSFAVAMQDSDHNSNNLHECIKSHSENGTATQVSSMQLPRSESLNEITNKFSSDSGYNSLDIGFSRCKDSSMDGFEENIRWVA